MVGKILKRRWRDFAMRAWKTFFQAFAAAFLIPDAVYDVGAWESAALAAVAAGISALGNLLFAVGRAKRLELLYRPGE